MRLAGRLASFALAAISLTVSNAGAQQPIGAVALGDLVQGLGVNTRVLVIGAHPDDEDTYLISYLARGKHVETAYLSLTRGEGGQNLIGNELGYALGQIRTEELLAARRVDGAHQYFTRAVDFGFSKTYAETDSLWPRGRILKDMITVIRAFRPHVIVSVWSGTDADGHGHHQYAGVMAREAFEQSANDMLFPVRDKAYLPPWQASKFYRTIRVAGGGPVTLAPDRTPPNVYMNVGDYNPLFGRSYAEIAGLSRSQHLSQGMGMMLPLGTLWDGVRLDTTRLATPGAADTSLFAGIDTTWSRFASLPVTAVARAALDSLPGAVRDAQAAFSAVTPEQMIPYLSRVVRISRTARTSIGCDTAPVPRCPRDMGDLALALNTTFDRASRALVLAAGVNVDATSEREQVAIKDSVNLTVAVYNRGSAKVELLRGTVNVEGTRTDVGVHDAVVLPDSVLRMGGRVEMPAVSYPWWLVSGVDENAPIYEFRDGPRGVGVDAQEGIVEQVALGEDRIRSSSVEIDLRIDGTDVRAAAPIVYRFADPARGEQRHPLAGVPKITTLFESSVEYIVANKPTDRPIRVVVHSAWSKPDTVNVTLGLPPGVRADSVARQVVIPPFGTVTTFFRLQGTVKQKMYKVVARATDRVGVYQQGFIEILYNHIRPVRYFQPPQILLSAVDVTVPAKLEVAYIRGVGDNVQRMLEQLGVKVKTVAPEALPILDLTAYNALVIGPRAYEAIETVGQSAAAIQNFARRGGTVVVQYTQIADRPGVLPYPVTMASPADRVTDEKAEVTFLKPAHPVLTTPNRITAKDFEDWGQERALYMPRTYDPRYTALFSMHDPGEPARNSAVLVAPLGKGMFIYTTLSFFRQLPAGSAGAARLFVNLLSAKAGGGVVP